MTPIKYTSTFCSKAHYLAKALVTGQPVVVVVPDGAQPDTGLKFPGGVREAKKWLEENGFVQS